jgi:drug/metabolite transporter (DMT)-like permease
LGNALTGPILGVTCFQWALRTTPAGLVQPIVAIAPLLTVPFAIRIERAASPRLSYYAGAILAIIGATGIVLAR